MDYIRKAELRGQANFGWLDSKHTFSFGHYYDAKHMGISALRVINDDWVEPSAGFDTHGHKDMEIISYVQKGVIEHVDSIGNQYQIPAGEVQVMSAGSGIMHSEYNASKTDELKFLQIWVQPNVRGIKPSYQQQAIAQTTALTPLVTPTGDNGTLTIHQDAFISRLVLKTGQSQALEVGKRTGYLHIISGSVQASNEDHTKQVSLSAGDGVGLIKASKLNLIAEEEIEALWFDLPSV